MAQQPTIDSVLKEKEFKEGDNQDKCPICLAQFNPKETVCVLPCQHSHHRACVQQWLRVRSPSCPVCRHNVLGGAQAAVSQPEAEVALRIQAMRNSLLQLDLDLEEVIRLHHS